MSLWSISRKKKKQKKNAIIISHCMHSAMVGTRVHFSIYRAMKDNKRNRETITSPNYRTGTKYNLKNSIENNSNKNGLLFCGETRRPGEMIYIHILNKLKE